MVFPFSTISANIIVFIWQLHLLVSTLQKQPSKGVLRKMCSENMQQIYRRTPMPMCDFNKVAMQLYWNHTSVWVFSYKFAACFRTPLPKNTSGRLLPTIYVKLNIQFLISSLFQTTSVYWFTTLMIDFMIQWTKSV